MSTKSKRSTPSSRARELLLREIDHTYWHGPERIIGATESLQLLGLFDPSRYPISARDRGDRVHRHTAARDRARLEGTRRRYPPVLPEERGYVASWHAFLDEWNPEFILVEAQLWCPTRRVAGTTDRLLVMRRRGLPKHLATVDLKTGDEEPWHAYQLSIYHLLVDTWLAAAAPKRLRTLPRIDYSAYLRKDGRAPKLRARPFNPLVHSLIAAAQAKRFLTR